MKSAVDIIKQTEENESYRKVAKTFENSQLVVMCIQPGEDIGEEVHEHTEQILFFHQGEGKGVLDGKEFPVGPGDVVNVRPGVKHNFINTGEEPLKIYTIYWPPHHLDGIVHATKAEAMADEEDERFGKEMESQYGI